MHLPSFKIYAMFVTHVLFHLKCYVRDKHSLSLKTLVKFVTHIFFQLKHCYEEKFYHYQIYHCLKVKPSFHKKLFQQAERKKLIVMYLCPVTFKSFVVQWSAKITGRQRQTPVLVFSVK